MRTKGLKTCSAVLYRSVVVCNLFTLGEVGVWGIKYCVLGSGYFCIPRAGMKDEACLALLHTGILFCFPVCFALLFFFSYFFFFICLIWGSFFRQDWNYYPLSCSRSLAVISPRIPWTFPHFPFQLSYFSGLYRFPT